MVAVVHQINKRTFFRLVLSPGWVTLFVATIGSLVEWSGILDLTCFADVEIYKASISMGSTFMAFSLTSLAVLVGLRSTIMTQIRESDAKYELQKYLKHTIYFSLSVVIVSLVGLAELETIEKAVSIVFISTLSGALSSVVRQLEFFLALLVHPRNNP